MFAFQFIAFILELSILLVVAGILIFRPIRFFNTKPVDKLPMYVYACNTINYKPQRTRVGILNRLTGVIISGFIIVWFAKPYILDIPRFVTGNYEHITGDVVERVKSNRSKDMYDRIIVQGKELKFFFDSNIKDYKSYTIGYLPNTSRAIYGTELEEYSLKPKGKIGFPIKGILIFIAVVFACVIIPAIITQYTRYKFMIATCILYYPILIYKWIKHGITSGIWFSLSDSNIEFTFIVMGILSILFLILFRFAEQKKNKDDISTIFLIQLFAILKIGILIGCLFLQ